jgi:UDP-N-acetylmuramyl tripeptide synthase
VLIINFLKLIVSFLRTFTGNSGTALPGLWLEKYFPQTAVNLLNQFEKVILITGTNGKTTTTQMICFLLRQNGIKYISNKSGSNLVRGVLSSVIDEVGFRGRIPKGVYAVFEVEEGSMPKLTKMLKPDVVVVTNVFRDQLDAYGEIDKTLDYICQGIKNANNPVLILNADDERVASLASDSENKKYVISINKKYLELIKLESKNEFDLDNILNLKQVFIDSIEVDDDLHYHYNYIFDSHHYKNEILAPGIHNVLNSVYAQISIIELLGEKAYLNLKSYPPAFGRGEVISVQQSKKTEPQNFQLLLAKNPAGLNLNFHLLENVKNREAVLLLLNDNTADGKDISWIWDADFSILKNLDFENIYISGTRAFDMALRYLYEFEGIKYNINKVNKYKYDLENDLGKKIHIYNKISFAIKDIMVSDAEQIYVLPTYTAMRELRDELAKYTKVRKMWK